MDRTPAVPGNVSAAAVLMITYGALMLLCSVCAGFNLATSDPEAEAMLARDVPAYRLVNLANAGSNLLTGILLLAIGMLLLNGVLSVRVFAILICVYELVLMVAHAIYQGLYVLPATGRFVAEQLGNQAMPFDVDSLVSGSLWTGLGAVILFTSLFCISIIVLLARPARHLGERHDGDGAPP